MTRRACLLPAVVVLAASAGVAPDASAENAVDPGAVLVT